MMGVGSSKVLKWGCKGFAKRGGIQKELTEKFSGVIKDILDNVEVHLNLVSELEGLVKRKK